MTADATRIAIVSPSGAEPGCEGANVLPGLRERGWDPRLVSGAPDGGDLRGVRIAHFLSAHHARSLLDVVSTSGVRAAVTVSAHDASVAGIEVPDYYGPLWERADAVHFPDEAVLSRALRRGCPPAKPRAVIPPLVDLRLFLSNGRPPADESGGRPLRVLCAGPLEWTGGYEHGLQAVAQARERGLSCECRVVGDGAHVSALLFARHQLGLSASVTFAEPAGPEALREHMRWADAFLAPTVIDGLPAHTIEACAMELCVVMSNPGPLGELMPDWSVVSTVPRREPAALAEALAALAADPQRRERMGAAARRWALERFRMEDHLDRLDELYRRVL
jgi:colanic acid/amylovoran biosynthesis glycosyltransferase